MLATTVAFSDPFKARKDRAPKHMNTPYNNTRINKSMHHQLNKNTSRLNCHQPRIRIIDTDTTTTTTTTTTTRTTTQTHKEIRYIRREEEKQHYGNQQQQQQQ